MVIVDADQIEVAPGGFKECRDFDGAAVKSRTENEVVGIVFSNRRGDDCEVSIGCEGKEFLAIIFIDLVLFEARTMSLGKPLGRSAIAGVSGR